MARKPLILIADDDRQVRDALDIRLSQADFEVVAAACSHDAVELFNRRQPDAAILDIEMPGSDGLSVCEHIRKTGSTIPVFILTGSDASIIKNHLEKIIVTVGANHFITKPYDGKSLVMMLRGAVQNDRCSKKLDALRGV